MRSLREWFSTFRIPEEMPTDGYQTLMSNQSCSLLTTWAVCHMPSSAYHTQSNGHVAKHEQVAKHGHVAKHGQVAKHALMGYCGRVLRDHLPSTKELCIIRPEWLSVAMTGKSHLPKGTSETLRHTTPGDPQVRFHHCGSATSSQLKKRTALHPKHWDKTGIVHEVLPHSQYTLQLHGSSWLTLCNPQFLRPIRTVCAPPHPTHQLACPSRLCPALHIHWTSGPVHTASSNPVPTEEQPDAWNRPNTSSTPTTPVPLTQDQAPPTEAMQSCETPNIGPPAPRPSTRPNMGQRPKHLQDFILSWTISTPIHIHTCTWLICFMERGNVQCRHGNWGHELNVLVSTLRSRECFCTKTYINHQVSTLSQLIKLINIYQDSSALLELYIFLFALNFIDTL